MPRKSTGKRERYEIFKRDGFACVYCGAKPDDGVTVLVIDHAVPISKGGSDTIENKVAACEPCNQGKGDRLLEIRAVRPDADMLYLEAMQEAAELRQYQSALLEKDDAIGQLVQRFQILWGDTSGLDWAPNDSTIRQWLNRYDPALVERVIRDVAPRVAAKRSLHAGSGWLPYTWAALRNHSNSAEQQAPAPAATAPSEGVELPDDVRLRRHLTNWYGVEYFAVEQLMAAAGVYIHFNPEPTAYNEDDPYEWDDWTRRVFEQSIKDVVGYALCTVFGSDPDVVHSFLDYLQEASQE